MIYFKKKTQDLAASGKRKKNEAYLQFG